MADLDGEISDLEEWHGLTNSVIVGVYLRLLADGKGDLARAWIDCCGSWTMGVTPLARSGPYSKRPRQVQVLTLRPMSSVAARCLRDSIDYLRDVVWEFAGLLGDIDALRSSPVWLEVIDPVQPSSDDRREDLLATLEQADDGADPTSQEFRKLVGRAALGWSYKSTQRVEHLAVPDLKPHEIERANEVIRAVGDRFSEHRVRPDTGAFNNWSFASNAPGPELVARAAAAVQQANPVWRVGVIVPGGEKAKSDVEDLYNTGGIEIDERRIPRGASDLPNKMAVSVAGLSTGNDALVIAYGGGDQEVLERVRQALREPLRAVRIPTWVAVGHAADQFDDIENPIVRVCRTPSDARALFLAETVEYARALGAVIARWSAQIGAPPVPAETSRNLVEAIGELDSDLRKKIKQHTRQG